MKKIELEQQLEELKAQEYKIRQQLSSFTPFAEKLEQIFSNMDITQEDSLYKLYSGTSFYLDSELSQLQNIHGKIIGVKFQQGIVTITVVEENAQ